MSQSAQAAVLSRCCLWHSQIAAEAICLSPPAYGDSSMAASSSLTQAPGLQDFSNIQAGAYKLPYDMTSTTLANKQYNPLHVLRSGATFMQASRLPCSVHCATQASNSSRHVCLYIKYRHGMHCTGPLISSSICLLTPDGTAEPWGCHLALAALQPSRKRGTACVHHALP